MPGAINGSRATQDVDPGDVFCIKKPMGETVPIRNLTELELRVAADSFERTASQHAKIRDTAEAIPLRELHEQKMIDALRMHAILQYELDRRTRVVVRP